MSNFIKTNPVGIDRPIQSFQTFLYGQLRTIWGLDDTSLSMCGRAYRNQTADGFSPEIFTGGIDYKEVFFNDRVSASSFFGLNSATYDAGTTTADVFLIFMVNLDKIKTPGLRQDEEARIDVELLCSQKRDGFSMTGFDIDTDKVFKEYSGWRKTDGILFKNQGKRHCFRINFKLIYKINI